MKIEVRNHYFLDEKVIIAPGRKKRPEDFVKEKFDLPAEKYSEKCPFCLGNEKMTPPSTLLVGPKKSWKFRVFPNMFPLLSPEIDLKVTKNRILRKMSGYGYHEVLVETPYHNEQWQNFSKQKFTDLVNTYKKVYQRLIKKRDINYVMIFKNYGKAGGASIVHSHSQIIGTPYLPGKIDKEVGIMKGYQLVNNSCAYCDIIMEEKNSKRKVAETKDFLILSPYSAEYPFELWLLSKKHVSDFMDVNSEELGKAIHYVVKKLFRVLGNFSFNLMIHHLPKKIGEDYHFHVSLQPRIKGEASVELGYGNFINVIFPERVASVLRSKK